MAKRKTRVYLSKAEFEAIIYFLSAAQEVWLGSDETQVEEIERLRKKLQQMQLQQKKV